MPRRHRWFIVTGALALALALPAGDLAGQAPEAGRGYPAADWPFTGGNWSSSATPRSTTSRPIRSIASAPRG